MSRIYEVLFGQDEYGNKVLRENTHVRLLNSRDIKRLAIHLDEIERQIKKISATVRNYYDSGYLTFIKTGLDSAVWETREKIEEEFKERSDRENKKKENLQYLRDIGFDYA